MGAVPKTVSINRMAHLDFLRGLAALLVLAGHLRAFVFVGHAPGDGVVTSIFYLVTGFSHQAVIIFFAMSGYLVGGKALTQIFARNFSWHPYLTRRLSRLWLVVIPSLLLTLALDLPGLWWANGYDGTYRTLYLSGPVEPGIDLSWQTLLANLFFLQTVTAPVFGSNGPMWSLANEFWYYLFIPMVFWTVFAAKGLGARSLGSALILAMILLLPSHFIEGGFIWLAGAVLAMAAERPRFSRYFQATLIRVAAILALLGAMVLARLLPGSGDLWFGVIVAVSLPVLAQMPASKGLYQRISQALAEISFTLYLTHLPLLMLIVMLFLAPDRFAFGAPGLMVFAALFALALLWATLIWWLFERHTNGLYRWLMQRQWAVTLQGRRDPPNSHEQDRKK